LADPVAVGFVTSLSRPGENMTGLASQYEELISKQVQLLKETVTHVGAIHVLPSPIFNAHRKRLIELAARYRLPAVYEFKNYVEDGGLMSYGPSINLKTNCVAAVSDSCASAWLTRALPWTTFCRRLA
jgi:hypothetical protein